MLILFIIQSVFLSNSTLPHESRRDFISMYLLPVAKAELCPGATVRSHAHLVGIIVSMDLSPVAKAEICPGVTVRSHARLLGIIVSMYLLPVAEAGIECLLSPRSRICCLLDPQCLIMVVARNANTLYQSVCPLSNSTRPGASHHSCARQKKWCKSMQSIYSCYVRYI